MCPVTYEASQCPRRQNCYVAFRFRPMACGRLDGTWESVTEFPGLGPRPVSPALEPWGDSGARESHSPLGPGRASSLRSLGMVVGKSLAVRSKAERESQDQGKAVRVFPFNPPPQSLPPKQRVHLLSSPGRSAAAPSRGSSPVLATPFPVGPSREFVDPQLFHPNPRFLQTAPLCPTATA